MAEDTEKKETTRRDQKDENLVTLTIDGQAVSVPKGTTVLEAANSIGIDIPTFCWHPKLKSVGACRMCYVEIEKFPKLMVSCATAVMPDMVVYTDSDKVKQGRRAVIEFILANHPLDCPTCDKGGECDLQNLTFAHGIDDSRFEFRKNRFVDEGMTTTFDDLKIGPEIILNRNRCILCYRCVRANKEAFGEYDLGVYERGNIAQINAAPGRQVDNPFSGNLVEICPVGALTNSDWRYKIRVWLTQTVASICPWTSSGSNILFYKEDHRDKIFRVTSRCNDDIDDGWIADVTRYGYQIVNSEDRLRRPLVKKGGKQVETSWDEALDLIHQRFTEIKAKKGAVCIGGLAWPGLDNSSLHAFNKFMRAVIGTNNVDFRSDYRMLPASADTVFEKLCRQPFRIADIDDSDVILSFGSDLVSEHPNEYLRIRKAFNFQKPRIYSMNPYSVKSADVADLEIVYNPGADEMVINAICLAAIEDGLVEQAHGEALKSKLGLADAARAVEQCGVQLEDVRIIARALSQGSKVTVMLGELIARSHHREAIASAVANMTKLFGLNEHGQVAVLARYSNSAGAHRLGVAPYLPKATEEEIKSLWGGLPECEPHNTDAMLALMKKEEIRGAIVFGGNPIHLYPDRAFVREGFDKLEFLVACDLFESDTTELADVVLPLCSWAEYQGDYVNLEGRVQTAYRGLRARGEAKPGYEIAALLAERFGRPLFDSDQQRQEEIDRLLGVQPEASWPADFLEVPSTAEAIEGEYTLPLFICDDPHHCGHLTEKAPSLANFQGEAYVEISSDLAARYELTEDDSVRVESPVAKVIAPVRISEWLDSDVVRLPRNFASTEANSLLMRKRRVDRVKISKVEK